MTTIYPGAISRAVAALDESPAFMEMPDGYFRVVIRIIKKINIANPTTPIVAARERFAKESARSEKTVERALAWLEENKFIKRQQIAQPGLRGSCSPITPTRALLKALSFGQVERPENYPQEKQELADSSVASRSSKQVNLQSKETSSIAGSSENRDARAKSVVVGKYRLPPDLAPLVTEQGLAPTGLLSLMSAAKRAGQRLSDIVAVAKEWLTGLHGREVYAYLLTLIRQGKDFKFIRAKEQDEAAMTAAAQANAERVAMKSRDWLGRKFSTSDGVGTIVVEPNGWLRVGKPCPTSGRILESTRKLDIEFVNLVSRGVLRAA